MKPSKPFYTSTANILAKMEHSRNCVTRAVYREIVGNRIDRAYQQKKGTINDMDNR